MRGAQHEQRRMDRESQTRSWAAPLPDFTAMPRVGSEPRTRVEWDTRDTMNSRMWADTLSSGPHDVTAAMLAAHPTAGAHAAMPSSGRQDERPYGESAANHWMVPGTPASLRMPGVQERPNAPPHSVFQNSWFSGVPVDGDVSREMRGVVKETNVGRSMDAAGRYMERTFQNQWMPSEVRQGIVAAQLKAAEALRPTSDDYRLSFGSVSNSGSSSGSNSGSSGSSSDPSSNQTLR